MMIPSLKCKSHKSSNSEVMSCCTNSFFRNANKYDDSGSPGDVIPTLELRLPTDPFVTGGR